jgi:hypothetical protein
MVPVLQIVHELAPTVEGDQLVDEE